MFSVSRQRIKSQEPKQAEEFRVQGSWWHKAPYPKIKGSTHSGRSQFVCLVCIVCGFARVFILFFLVLLVSHLLFSFFSSCSFVTCYFIACLLFHVDCLLFAACYFVTCYLMFHHSLLVASSLCCSIACCLWLHHLLLPR